MISLQFAPDLYESCQLYPGGLSYECKTKTSSGPSSRMGWSLWQEQKAGGLTVRQWCEVNHFSFHTYNYWKHLFKEEVVNQVLPDIVPIAVPTVPDSNSSLEISGFSSIRSNCTIRANQSFMKLNINGISIEIDDSVSVEFLSKLFKAVHYA